MWFGKKANEVAKALPTRVERMNAEDGVLRRYVVGLLDTNSRFVSIRVGGTSKDGMTLQEKMQTALSVISGHSSVVSVQPFVEYGSSHMGGAGRGYSTAYLLVTLKSTQG